MDRFRFGLSGLTGPLTQRRLYGDNAPSLDAYAGMFQVYEIGASQHPHWTASMARDLVERMPSKVRLVPQMSRSIVQDGGLAGNDAEFDRWLDSIAPVLAAHNKGPLLLPWQGAWSADSEASLEHLLEELWPKLPSSQQVAVEFRHGSWFRPGPVHMLEEYGATLVWSTAGGIVPHRATADTIYVRLGGNQSRRIPDEVAALASRITKRPEDDRPVYVISSRYHDPYGLRALERFGDMVGAPVHYGARTPMPQQVPAQPSLRAFA